MCLLWLLSEDGERRAQRTQTTENARERSKAGTQNAGTQLPQNAANAERRGTQQPWNAAERRAVAPRTQNSPERSRTQSTGTQLPRHAAERSRRGTQRNAEWWRRERSVPERSGTQLGFSGFWLLWLLTSGDFSQPSPGGPLHHSPRSGHGVVTTTSNTTRPHPLELCIRLYDLDLVP